ncbi:hypothetical protein [Nocardia sp. NPDC052566]|uniref:hypothetical protein n=1 Tax=Nocardia sp. NPDC052566 TaxID=3364330 RepID=UPI0037CB265B
MSTPGELETDTFTLAEVVEKVHLPSEDWLKRRLNAGTFSGRRAGKTWSMTRSDIAAMIVSLGPGLDVPTGPLAVPEPPAPADLTGLTRTSRRRLGRTP